MEGYLQERWLKLIAKGGYRREEREGGMKEGEGGGRGGRRKGRERGVKGQLLIHTIGFKDTILLKI